MKKYKILFILHLPPPVHGASMMGEFIKNSHIINSNFTCKYINITTAENLEDIGRLNINKIYAIQKLKQKISTTYNDFKPDLVYITPNAGGVAFIKDYYIFRNLKKNNANIIAHYHNKGFSTYSKNLFYNCLYRLFFKKLDIILLSRRLYPDIEKYVKTENVNFCSNGIPIVQEIYKVKQNVTQVLYLSNLIKTKGVIILLDACKILKNKGLNFTCQIVGGETSEISKQHFYDEIQSRDLNDVVTYHGKKYGLEKNKILESSDILAFPTYYHKECFPVVLLEAMQHKIACISTNEAAIPEIIEDNVTGLICKKESSIDLAYKLEMLINDKNRCTEMGEAGYNKFNNKYTLEIFENNLVNIFITNITNKKIQYE